MGEINLPAKLSKTTKNTVIQKNKPIKAQRFQL